MLGNIAQMCLFFCQSHIRINITLNIVVSTHMIAERGAYLLIKHLSCMSISALQVGIYIMMSLAIVVFSILLLDQQGSIVYCLFVVR